MERLLVSGEDRKREAEKVKTSSKQAQADDMVYCGLVKKKCAYCGCTFETYVTHSYRHGEKIFCRYNHMRAWERENGIERDQQRVKECQARIEELEKEEHERRQHKKPVGDIMRRIDYYTEEMEKAIDRIQRA